VICGGLRSTDFRPKVAGADTFEVTVSPACRKIHLGTSVKGFPSLESQRWDWTQLSISFHPRTCGTAPALSFPMPAQE
jgi:hypothetical protein